MATKRKSLTKKTRFEVFKRDSFKCQYCGACAPEAVLVVDHIEPLSKDGADDMMNYITACQPCNAGKSDRVLGDNTTVQKQKGQLDELNERREQLEMMLKWRDGLKDIDSFQMDVVADAWSDVAIGWHLNDTGLKTAKGYVKKHGLKAVLEAIEKAGEVYIKTEEGKATKESVELAWSKVGGIMAMAAMPEETRQLYYIKGILRNRLSYVPYDAIKDLQAAAEDGVDVEDIKLEAKHARSWTQFSQWLHSARGT